MELYTQRDHIVEGLDQVDVGVVYRCQLALGELAGAVGGLPLFRRLAFIGTLIVDKNDQGLVTLAAGDVAHDIEYGKADLGQRSLAQAFAEDREKNDVVFAEMHVLLFDHPRLPVVPGVRVIPGDPVSIQRFNDGSPPWTVVTSSKQTYYVLHFAVVPQMATFNGDTVLLCTAQYLTYTLELLVTAVLWIPKEREELYYCISVKSTHFVTESWILPNNYPRVLDLEPMSGIEPLTSPLPRVCSTN